MNKKERTINQFTELLKISDNLNIESIQLINTRNLMNFTDNVLTACVECNFNEIKKYCDFFEQLNFILDEYIEEHIEIKKKYYNVLILSFLSDAVQAFSIKQGKQEVYQWILGQKHYSEILKTLHKRGHLTQKQLAEALEMSTQNLANYLAKIRNDDVFISYSFPKQNSKNVYYALSANCKKYLEKEANKRKTLSERYEYSNSDNEGYEIYYGYKNSLSNRCKTFEADRENENDRHYFLQKSKHSINKYINTFNTNGQFEIKKTIKEGL